MSQNYYFYYDYINSPATDDEVVSQQTFDLYQDHFQSYDSPTGRQYRYSIDVFYNYRINQFNNRNYSSGSNNKTVLKNAFIYFAENLLKNEKEKKYSYQRNNNLILLKSTLQYLVDNLK
jgi:hypothetical protein